MKTTIRTIEGLLIIVSIFLLTNTVKCQGQYETDPFGYGFDYARLPGFFGIDSPHETAGETGADWIKLPWVYWDLVRPDPGMPYEWEALDLMVKNYQQEGFEIWMQISCNAEWACEEVDSTVTIDPRFISRPPKAGYWDDYSDFVRDVVERYDYDGDQNDMPGLVKGINYFEIESEAQHDDFWQVPEGYSLSPVEAYGVLLDSAYNAVHSANPEAKVILSGVNFGDIFDNGLNYSTDDLVEIINLRFQNYPQIIQFYLESLHFIDQSISFINSYDAVEFHYNSDYISAYGVTDYLRSKMLEYGEHKPIWAGDALISNHNLGDVFLHVRHPYPYVSSMLLDILSDTSSPYNREMWDWHLEEQASNLVKKIVLSLHTGIQGIMSANECDWLEDLTYGGTYWEFAGFYGQDSELLPDYAKGQRPVTYTYRFLSDSIGTSPKNIERIPYGNEAVYMYEITRSNLDTIYVLWYEDPATAEALETVSDTDQFFTLLNSRESVSVDLSQYSHSTSLLVTKTITEHNVVSPYTYIAPTDNIVVGHIPIICFPESSLSVQGHLNKEITIYPNPSSGSFTVDSDNIKRITLYDIYGNPVFETSSTKVQLSGYTTGIYIVKIESYARTYFETLILSQ